jgi:murein DD-endopeptidase MepM/ murein hydrolase activator NlpD
MNLYLERPLPDGIGEVTQRFGENPATYKKFGLAGHNGLDYGVPEGTPVLAAHDGTVTEVGDDPAGYGLFVKVQGLKCLTLYAHLRVQLVKAGDEIGTGQQIGEAGNTGNSTGSHLHWGVKLCGMRNPAYNNWIDPVPFRTE